MPPSQNASPNRAPIGHGRRTATTVDRPGRACILSGANDLYGASRGILFDVEALHGLGWEVDVLLPEDGPLTPELVAAGAGVEITDLAVLRKVTLRRTRVPVTLPARAAQADLVVPYTLALATYLPALAARRRPTVCSVHEIQPSAAGAALAAAAGLLSGCLLANSRATARWLARSSPRRRRSPIVCYPVAPPYDPLPLPPADTPFQVLTAGRVNGHKGHVEAVEACRMARADGLDVRLTLLGSPYPGQERHLDDLQRAIGGEDWVAFLGQVDDIRPHMAEAHVLLVPSTSPEPFGLVALEGWAAGRLVIGSDTGGLSEAIALVGGLACPPRDVRAIADALLRTARSSAHRSPAGASAAAATVCSILRRQDSWREALRLTARSV
jgi:hypothetical protein